MSPALAALIVACWAVNDVSATIKCYSCANDFIVWQWRHFFLKRNYGLSESDPSCSHRNYRPETFQSCHSTCFVFYLNGTNKETRYTKTLGVGRGCSSQFLSDDQHMHLGLGSHSRPSEVGTYLPHDFDKLDLTEHWCFCATEFCNVESCFSVPYGSREFGGSYLAKRYQYYGDYTWGSASREIAFIVFVLLLL